jgi:transcriptional regulator with XRE-family HTH domain
MSAIAPRYTGTKIRSALVAQGRRQDWLARQVGISAAMLNLAMSGKRTLGSDVAERISLVLQVPFDLLFDSPIGSKSSPIGSSEEPAA